MDFSGEERFSLSTDALWERLANLDFLASILPGLERIESIEPEKMVCRVKPGFSFLTGTLKLTLEIVEQEQPNFVRVRVLGKGIGTSMLVETLCELSHTEGETSLSWKSEVQEMGGMLKSVSRGLIEAAARKVIDQAWVNFRRELGRV